MNVRKLLRSKLIKKADVPKPLPAVVGNGAGLVEVPGRDKYVYVRIGNSLAQAYCDYVPRHGAKVLVGYDTINPRLFRVLMNGGGGGEVGEIITSDRYRWAAPGGGQDPLMVELRQFLPARLGPAGGLKVSVYPGVAWCGTAWKLVGGSTHDLSTMVPATSGKARMVLFCIDDNGNITTTAGSEVDISSLSINDLPLPPSGSVYAIGAVRLYAGQTVIREARTNTDIVDLRFPLSVVRGGGDMLKAIYDTDNDGVVDAAESVPWSGVTDKPSTFPPSSHTHSISDVSGHDKAAHDALGINADTLDGQHASAFAQASHTHTPSQVGLGNVTNDAQLKRAGNDFTGFAEKTTPADNDLILSEDSVASYAKKKITLGNIYLWIKGRLDSLYAALSHQHAANDVTSGVFDAARIPDLDASKITTGTLSTSRFSAYDDLEAENKLGIVNNTNLLRGIDQRIAVRVGRNDERNGYAYQTVSNNTWTAVNVSYAVFDYPPEGAKDHYTGNNYVTIRANGLYLVTGRVSTGTPAAAGRIVLGLGTSPTVADISATSIYVGTGFQYTLVAIGIAYLESGTNVYLNVYQQTGDNLNLLSYTPVGASPHLALVYLAPV